MSEDWKEQISRLRENKKRNERDYIKQRERYKKRVRAISLIHDAQTEALRARKGGK